MLRPPDVLGIRLRMETAKGPLMIELHVAEDVDDECVALADEEPTEEQIVRFFGPCGWTLSGLVGRHTDATHYKGRRRQELGTALAAMAYVYEMEGKRKLVLDDIRKLQGWKGVGARSPQSRQTTAALILGSKRRRRCSLVDASDSPQYGFRAGLAVDVDDEVLVLLGRWLWPKPPRGSGDRAKHLMHPLLDHEIDALATRHVLFTSAFASAKIAPPGTDPYWTLALAQLLGFRASAGDWEVHGALEFVRDTVDAKNSDDARPVASSSHVEAVCATLDSLFATTSAWVAAVPPRATLDAVHERVRICAACGRRTCAECLGTRRCPVCDRWLCDPCIAVDSQALPRICEACGLAACADCLVYRDTRDSLLSQSTWQRSLRCSRCDVRRQTDIPVREEPGARARAGILDAAARVDDLRRYRALGHRLTPWDALTGSFPMDAHEDCGEDEPIEGEARNIACVWLPQGETVWLLDRLMRDGLIELRDGEFVPRGDASTDRIDPT